MFLKFYFTLIKFNYLNIIFIVKLIRLNIIILFQFDYNINRLILFHFENDVNNILKYNNLRSYEYTLYILRFSKLELYL